MRRDCDDQICSICHSSITSNDIGYRISVPKKKLKKLSNNTIKQLLVRWDTLHPVNYFHQSCWNNVKNTANGRIGKTELNLMHEVRETIERFDTIEQLRINAKILGDMIKNANRVIAFTGAGISASAGIPTYRGAEGIDTQDAYAGSNSSQPTKKRKIEESDTTTDLIDLTEDNPLKSSLEEEQEEEEMKYELLMPTYAHKALTVLHQNGYLHYCITQNCDNLHQKSLFPREFISELHGNVFCEYCEKCFHEYYRSYAVDEWSTDCYNEPWFRRCPQCHYGHYTGRKCSQKGCQGRLKDTIVNFGDDLHERVLGGYPAAERECNNGDICLAIGTSLTVSPANDLPLRCKELVILNLQETDYDSQAKVRCWSTADMMMKLILEELNIASSIVE